MVTPGIMGRHTAHTGSIWYQGGEYMRWQVVGRYRAGTGMACPVGIAMVWSSPVMGLQVVTTTEIRHLAGCRHKNQNTV